MSTLLIIGLKNAILVVPLALLALGIGRWSRRPALAHVLWTLVLVKLLTPPLMHIPVGWQMNVESWLESSPQPLPPGPHFIQPRPLSAKTVRNNSWRSPSNVLASQKPVRGLPSKSLPRAVTPNKSSWLSWAWVQDSKTELLGAIWLVGSLYIILKLVQRSYQFHRFLRMVERRHESLGPRAAELAARARITIAPRVIVVDSVVSPMLWGMGRRACLVFPAKLVARLSGSELDALLLHELAHFARGDHWVRVLELTASILYWWHPIVWWARHELEVAEEQCCDGWVVEHQNGTRVSYAEALLATIDFLHEPALVRPPVVCGLGEVPFLRKRLTQIMRGQVAARLPTGLTCLILIGGLLCSPFEPSLWAHGSAEPSLIQRQLNSLMANRVHRLPSGADTIVSAAAVTTVDLEPRARSTPFPVGLSRPDVDQPSKPPTELRSWKSPRAAGFIWASAEAPNGKFRLEAKLETKIRRRTTLAANAPGFPLDLTAYQITCVSISADSRTFATGHIDTLVRRWDSDTGGVMQSYKGCNSIVTSVHLSPDRRFLAAGTESGRVVVWDVASADEVARLESQGAAVSCVRWSGRGDQLAITLGGWSQHEANRLILWVPVQERILAEQELEQPVGAIQWGPQDGSLLLAGWDGFSLIMNPLTGQVSSIVQIDKDLVSAAAWSPDCRPLSTVVGNEVTTGND